MFCDFCSVLKKCLMYKFIKELLSFSNIYIKNYLIDMEFFVCDSRNLYLCFSICMPITRSIYRSIILAYFLSFHSINVKIPTLSGIFFLSLDNFHQFHNMSFYNKPWYLMELNMWNFHFFFFKVDIFGFGLFFLIHILILICFLKSKVLKIRREFWLEMHCLYRLMSV